MKMFTLCENIRVRATHPINRNILGVTKTHEGVILKVDRIEHGEGKYFIFELTNKEWNDILEVSELALKGESLL